MRGNRVTLLHDGACLPAILEEVQAARREILFEMYWFGSDATGRRFAEALSEKARQGVKVSVIYDAVGSLEAEEAMFDAMREAGCAVRQYNPIAPWRQRFHIGMVNNRDHRKIVVVDQRVGMTGGVNIGDPWAPEPEGEGWRDDMIRIEGIAALRMRELFLRTWRELGGESAEPTMSEAELRSAVTTIPDEGPPVRVLAGDFRQQRAVIRRSYIQEIRRAERSIYITNSYFVPDREVRQALCGAARRGVDVRVLLPGENDVLAVYYAARRLYAKLMDAGIALYHWEGPILHAKTATFDDRWCTVGTFNMDYRSWRSNLEVNVTIEDAGVASAMAERFRADLSNASKVDPREWSYRPLSSRVLEHFFYAFRKLL